MALLDELRARTGAPRPRVLFSDGSDPRVAAVVAELAQSRAAQPSVLPASRGNDLGATAERLAARTGADPRALRRLLERPVYAALALLADGEVDAVIAGVASHTRDVLIACDMIIPRAPGREPSSAFVLDSCQGPLVFADCAVNPSPTATQLADIALASADTARAVLGSIPRVAMLSFSTHGSATHPDVDKVIEATAMVRARDAGLIVDGDIQADAALDARVALYKIADAHAPTSNVLVFPDLDAANIGYKLVRTLGRAPAFGAFIQGYTKPIVKLSRGSTTDEILGTCLLLRQLVRS